MKVRINIPNADSMGGAISPSVSVPDGTLRDALKYVKSWERVMKPGTTITIEV